MLPDIQPGNTKILYFFNCLLDGMHTTFYCLRDNKTSLLWMVPLSSRVEKFKAIHDKQMAKYGKCLTIVLGEFDGKEAAFLLQNMFPIKDYYLDHRDTILICLSFA